jgi:hypothetical protein
LIGVVACLSAAGAQVVDLSDSEADIFTSYFTTWPPEAMDVSPPDGIADIESYRSRDANNNAYFAPLGYATGYYSGGLDGNPLTTADNPAVWADRWIGADGFLYVHLEGSRLKPHFAYQIKLIGKPAKKWGAAGSDLANERIGGGRWWCTQILNSTGDIVNAWNSTDSEYQTWKSRGFADATYTYLFEGYLLFDFVLTDSVGSFAYTAATDQSYHVLWQCSSTGTAWNAWGYGPSKPLDTTNINSRTLANNADWYSAAPTGTVYVAPETEDTAFSLATGSYPAFLVLAEESFHANLPPQYGPAYTDGLYGGCWMSALCAPVEFTIPTVHVGDLDKTSWKYNKTSWKASVTVTAHANTTENPLAGAATVYGTWSGGYTRNVSGTTNPTTGTVTFTTGTIQNGKTSATFRVTNVVYKKLTYSSAANHDPDGDSNGTSITAYKP